VFGESHDPPLGAFGVVLLGECASDGVADACAAGSLRSHRNFEFPNLNGPTRLTYKGAKPSGWFVVPGAHKHPAFDNYYPDAGVTVLSSGANAKNFCIV
jgi:hypothetical protein